MDTSKRARSSSESSAESAPPSPVLKAFRSSTSSGTTWTCSLPPSCHQNPQAFATSSALDAHHRTFHAFTCSAPPPTFDFAVAKGEQKLAQAYGPGQEPHEAVCGRVFPDERMLALHLTECHDELAQLRRERGEKIPTCSQLFLTPKGRRLHLVEKHAYPAQYFFGVTIWGIQEVLKKGGGMVRREWKPREGQTGWKGDRAGSDDSFGSPPSPAPAQLPELLPEPGPVPASSADVDDLAAALSGTSISLIPRSVRLARKNQMTS
ncbi:hypothetical protein Rhopal_005790-T1 [Rhodotorula paludigena]|uniref:C2H2-type domain-containing protein n=1 Tax=Rhodotorula paludigena TaxID=86838 RepID=A0AAV5GUN0_9BASI|nr:hypothetical protein Rhopal_005790-T1 [Rhodotorula paludigena]